MTCLLIGTSEIQLLITIQSGDLGFIQNLPVLFDSLEKRTQLETITTAVQQTIRQRPIGTAMTCAMHAASGVSAQRLARINVQARTAVMENAINWGIGDAAFVNALGVVDLGDDFRAPFRSSVPVLIMSGTLDGRAVENDARRVGAHFDQVSYVTIEGASHDFWFLRPPPRVPEVTNAFLRGEAVPDEPIAWPVSFRWPGLRTRSGTSSTLPQKPFLRRGLKSGARTVRRSCTRRVGGLWRGRDGGRGASPDPATGRQGSHVGVPLPLGFPDVKRPQYA